VVLGITNDPGSPLADAVVLLLSTDAGPERAVPATKTVTAQLAVLVTVTSALRASAADGTTGAAAGALGGAPGGGTLDGLPGAVAGVLGDPGPVERLADRWRGLDRLVVAGRGLAYAAALETALKVKETTGILAEGISTADLLHGPIAAVYAGAPVLLVDGGGPADIDLDELRALLASRRAQAASLPVPPGLAEAVHVIAAITRGQQLAYELARARHVDPDAPAHLSKVTATT